MSDEVTGNPDLGTDEVSQATETSAEAGDDELLDSLDTEANPENEEAPKDEPPAPRKLKVKIDGQEFEVDEEEAAKGYQRQQDYSRNMQRLQAEMHETNAAKARYSQQLEQFIPESVARINALQQAAEQYRNEGNVEGLAMVQYDLNAEIMRYQQANAEKQRLGEEQQTQVQHQRQQALQHAEQAVIESIPEWKNPQVRKAEIAEVAKVIGDFVGKHYGEQTPQIMRDINDGLYGPMPVILARKAMLYDKLMAKVAARKAGKSEETSAPAPVTQVRSTGGASKDPANMSAQEFAAWRRKQIANRS
jgi:hypothetical protein